MRVARLVTASIAAAVGSVSAAAVIATPVALAGPDPAIYDFGDQAALMDGSVVQGWTVSGLKKSSDTVPYAVQGTLWEATATDEALQDQAVPIVSNFNARTHSGQTYRALFQVATPEGVNPSALMQGQRTTGKVYFDATDDAPDSVAYNDGSRDRAVWVQTPAPTQPESAQPPRPGTSGATPSGMDAVRAAPGAGTVPVFPNGQETGLPTGRQGTPESPGWQGTPLAPGSQGTPLAPGSQGTPLAPGWQGTPLPSANQGEPASAQTVPDLGPADGVPALAAPSPSAAPLPTADNGAPPRKPGAAD